jgi:serine/threonine protein phosphatase PrpC
MADVNVLYTVTAVVLLALLIWAGWVLATKEDAPDESPKDEDDADAPAAAAAPKGKAREVVIRDETPPPTAVEVSAPSERAVAIGGKAAPVVLMPVMRSRLDSHSEISDDSAEAEPAPEPTAEAEPAPNSMDSVMPPAGPPLSLVSAIGRSDPAEGPTERSAIVDRHHLFLLADGGGQRVQNELVSAVVVDALAAAFEVGADATVPPHATLPRRGDRLRRSVLAALSVLESRGKEEGLDMTKVGVLAAHFSPDNRRLFIATVGVDRAYRLRATEVVQLNKAGLAGKTSEGTSVDVAALETVPDDVYVFGTEKAFHALGDELRPVLTIDPSIDRVAAHFVAAATRGGKSTGMTAIVVRVDPPRPSARPPTL